MKKLGIYVHIPYCIKKCRYCDFASTALCDAKIDADDYTYAVCDEIEEMAKKIAWSIGDEYLVDSIFFGGGTPTCIGTDQLVRILLAIKHNFNVSDNAEISIEANPETVTLAKFKALKSFGFNRVSMGVQSLNDDVLKAMGRVHNAEKAGESFKVLRESGFDNINLDLMFGVPNQTLEIWQKTLDEVIQLNPEHISFYSLQLEEGTAFYTDYRNGKIDLPTWEENRAMYHYAVQALKDAGYHHYEISNAAKPGKECRHNLKYWTMEDYLGFGSAAHSFMKGVRFYNPDGIEEYVKTYQIEYSPEDEKELETDRIFTGLRLVDGTDFGSEFYEKYKDLIKDLIDRKLLILDDRNRLKFTDLGLDNTNNVIQEFFYFQGGFYG